MDNKEEFVSFNYIYDYVKSYTEAEGMAVPSERTVRDWLNNGLKKQTVEVVRKHLKYDWVTASQMLSVDHQIDINYIRDVIEYATDTKEFDETNVEPNLTKYANDDEYKKDIDRRIFETKLNVFMNVYLINNGYSGFDNQKIFDDLIKADSNDRMANLNIKNALPKNYLIKKRGSN
ncbi:hypothetical protein AKUH3B110M_UNKNOWN200100 (plasmid) [Apilactobacillus kunkeei]|nr:hypothetical protein AKUH3B110M_UNKNOWN200100 [Apilactobacillus kunkeei]CAI2700385.1 hypothetical protein AKUH3B107A_UNKNOWN200100 [Apilactobacillus kunkeei]CAI2700398.1 hypothetical protein AKUH3B102X_UNKNOWN200100 [Apilactobacillus kunkeei]